MYSALCSEVLMYRYGVFLAGVFLLSLNLSCSDPVGPDLPDPITELPRALTPSEQIVIARSNTFGFELLRQADQRKEGDQANTILSPLSASMALGMALEGADGETFTEMQAALGFQGMARDEINASYAGLLDLLLDLDPAVEIGIANSAWSRLGFPFTSTYFDAITTSFQAMVQELDFDDPGAKDIINQWVRDQTNGRIDGIIDSHQPPGHPLPHQHRLLQGRLDHPVQKGEHPARDLPSG